MTSEADIFEYQSKRPVTTRTGFGGLDLSAEEGQFTVIYDGWDGTPFRVRNIEVERYLSKTKKQTTVDKEQFLLLEDLYETIEKHQELLDKNIHNQVMLEHIEKQLEKALNDIEKLKDASREMKYTNGTH